MKPAHWLVLAAVGMVVAGFAWPTPPIPRAQKTDVTVWAAPPESMLTRAPGANVAAVRQGIRWMGNPDDMAGAEGQAQEWKLTGIVFAPAATALILPKGGKLHEFQIGDTLPDGSKIHDIDHESMTTELDGCRRGYQLHHARSTRSPECPEDATP